MVSKIYPHKLARAFLSFDVSSLSSLADAEKSLLVCLAPCGGEALTRPTRLAKLTKLARLGRGLPDNAIYQLLSAFVGFYLFRFLAV